MLLVCSPYILRIMLKKFFIISFNSYEDRNIGLKTKIADFISALIFLAIFLLVYVFMIAVINILVLKYYEYNFLEQLSNLKSNQIFGKNKYFGAFLALFLAPLIEEFAYRYHLSLKKNCIIISLAILSFVHLGGSIFRLTIDDYFTWIKISLILVIMVFGGKIINDKVIQFFKKHYMVYVYTFALFFAFGHTDIYIKNLQSDFLYILPILVLPQFVLALVCSYLRLKNGIVWAIFFHFLFNLPMTLKNLL